MEGETPPASKVLDDEDLLAEIVVRVGCPISLVRAAVVCKRWLTLASDRAFLRRFRKLHPPRLLGFYHAQRLYQRAVTRFFPMLPQHVAPELAAVVRRSSRFRLDSREAAETDMLGCWNGRVVTSRLRTVLHKYHNEHHNELRSENIFAVVVHSPLCPARGMVVTPALPLPSRHEGNFCTYRQLFSDEEGQVWFYLYVTVKKNARKEMKSTLHVYVLQNDDDAWRTQLTLAVDYFFYAKSVPAAMLTGNKIYMASALHEIIVLDLTASTSYTMQLPHGVDFRVTGTTMLSRADDPSDFCLIHAKELQLHVWLNKRGNWLPVHTICLREMCARFLQDDPTAILEINHVGDYTTKFLFLKMGRWAFYLDVKCRSLHKLYEMTKEDQYFARIYPFTMSWPPIFPALRDAHARFAS
ncbi:unnamed protein product [Alopecurus aequalis]